MSNIFEWENGTTHALQVTTSIILGNATVRNVFQQWTDGPKDPSRTLRITKHGDYSALFKTQYALNIISDFGNPQGCGWYNTGSEATFSVTSPPPEPSPLRLLGGKIIFQGWTGNSTSK